MLIDLKDVRNLPVYAKSGKFIGKIDDFIIETDSQSIYQYIIKPSGIKNFFGNGLLISREQILSITKEKIIVEDASYSTEKNKDGKKTTPCLQTTEVITTK